MEEKNPQTTRCVCVPFRLTFRFCKKMGVSNSMLSVSPMQTFEDIRLRRKGWGGGGAFCCFTHRRKDVHPLVMHDILGKDESYFFQNTSLFHSYAIRFHVCFLVFVAWSSSMKLSPDAQNAYVAVGPWQVRGAPKLNEDCGLKHLD